MTFSRVFFLLLLWLNLPRAQVQYCHNMKIENWTQKYVVSIYPRLAENIHRRHLLWWLVLDEKRHLCSMEIQIATDSKTDVYNNGNVTPEREKKQKKPMSLIKLEQCAGAEHHTSVFSPAEQSEGNEISRLGCGLSVIRFHRPSLSTAGSRSYKHAAMSAHHPACLSLLLALFLNFRFCVSLSGVLLCLFALHVPASEYNSVLPSIRRWMGSN